MDNTQTQRNLPIVAFVASTHFAVLFVLPILLNFSYWAILPFALLVWLNVTHWALIHEAIHKLLHHDPQQNERLGRVLAILFGASFHVLRFGHLMHHKLNRDWHSEHEKATGFAGRLRYYYTLTIGLYLSEVTMSVLMALLPEDRFMKLADSGPVKNMPEVSLAGRRFFYQRGNVEFVRRDMAAAGLLYFAALLMYGVHWPVLVAFILARGFVVSVFDNLYHFGTPVDNSKAAKELTLSAPISALLLHGNYHETHHLNPDVPWSELPGTSVAQNRRFDGGLVSHGLMQFGRSPILA